MSETIAPPPGALLNSHCTREQYEAMYRRSIDDPDGFWAEHASIVDWVQPPTIISSWTYNPVSIKWYEDGVLNLCYNCVDRHLAERADSTALIWEGDEPGVTKSLSY